MRSRALIALFFLLLAAPVAAAEWRVVRAGHFEVFTDMEEPVAASVARLLLRTRAGLDAATEMDVSMSAPLRVFVFGDRAEFLRAAEPFFGRRAAKAGFSIVQGDAKLILLDGHAPQGNDLLRHELVHHFAYQTYGQQPLWLAEGMAEVYASLDVRQGSVVVGKARWYHLSALRRQKEVPLRELLSADETSRWNTDGFEQRRFYSQTWLFTHYLLMKRPDDLRRFTALLREKPLDQAFAETFGGMTYDQLQRDVQRYAKLVFITRRVPLDPEVALEVPTTPRVVTKEELQAHLDAVAAQKGRSLISITYVENPPPELLARYDAAVAKIAIGELAEAVAMLDKLVAKAPEGELRENATGLVKQVREQIRRNQ